MGLAHILNVEGEKMQYVLSLKADKNMSPEKILAVNDSIERVIKSVTRLQFILQEKLENVIQLIPKEHDSCIDPKPPWPKPPRPKPCCSLVGCGVGNVKNQDDAFCGAIATLEALDKNAEIGDDQFPIKYSLFKRGKNCNISAVLVPIHTGLKISCPKLQPCPRPEQPNLFVMKGKAIMCIDGIGDKQDQATVNFTLKVWDYGIRRQFQVVTWSDRNQIFNHDSGVVDITQGNLRIKGFVGRQEQSDIN